MGEKDISEKLLIDYNDVFADIVNICVFNGVEKIKQDDLEKAAVYSQYKAEAGKLHQEERDGASYRTQLLAKRKRIAPVVSLVLYFGTEARWEAHKSIKELMCFPKELDDYVNDYKINVIEVAWLTEEQLRMFKSDFGIVANFFVQKRKNRDYIPDNRVIKHVDEMLKLLSVMTGDNNFEKILYNDNGEKEEVNSMCEVLDKWKQRGIEEGFLSVIKKKTEKGISIEEIANALEMTVDEVEKLAAKLQ